MADGFAALFGAFFLVWLVIAVVLIVLFLLPTIQAYKAKRSGWWVYLICFFITPLNIAALIAWFAHFKTHPTKLGQSDIVI
ncbi:MAG: hypothetical protein V4510_03110 [bacterium]